MHSWKLLLNWWHHWNSWWPGGHLNIKMPSYQYRTSHYRDKMVWWLYYLCLSIYNRNPSTGKHSLINILTHWGRVTHVCVSKLTIIGSDNGLSPDRRQAIIWTNAGILLHGPLGTNFSEILIEILTFSFKKMHLKVSAKRRPFSLGLHELKRDPDGTTKS